MHLEPLAALQFRVKPYDAGKACVLSEHFAIFSTGGCFFLIIFANLLLRSACISVYVSVRRPLNPRLTCSTFRTALSEVLGSGWRVCFEYSPGSPGPAGRPPSGRTKDALQPLF